MNKSDIVNEVAKVLNSKKEAELAFACIIETITNALKKGGAVSLIGFGSFKVDKRKARKGRNPKTGKEIEIRAKNIPKFLPGKGLRDLVNRGD